MRKNLGRKHILAAVGLGVLLCLSLAPTAMAHGAPEMREFDAKRVLKDDGDGGQDYGGCPDSTPDNVGGVPVSCPGDEGAMDLLALDVREAHYNGTPVLAFRTYFQIRAASVAGRTVDLTFKAAGKPVAVQFTGDGKTFTSTTCLNKALLAMDVGDGLPKGIDCYVSEAALNLTVGAKVEDVVEQSSVGTNKGDYMPGGWYSHGQIITAVPPVEAPDPSNPQAPETPPTYQNMETPGTYDVAGPAHLLNLTLAVAPANSADGLMAHVTVGNPLKQTAQVANFTLLAPGGSHLDILGASLQPNATASVMLSVPPQRQATTVTVLATSDLGAYETIVIPIPATLTNSTCTGGGNTTSCPSPSSTTTSAKASPDAGACLAATALVGLALLRRRAL